MVNAKRSGAAVAGGTFLAGLAFFIPPRRRRCGPRCQHRRRSLAHTQRARTSRSTHQPGAGGLEVACSTGDINAAASAMQELRDGTAIEALVYKISCTCMNNSVSNSDDYNTVRGGVLRESPSRLPARGNVEFPR
jgi:hypothetical protein